MTTYEEIPNLIRLNKFATFKVSTDASGNKDFVFISDKDSDNIETDINDLDALMSALSGHFFLFGQRDKNATRNQFRIKFSKISETAKVAGIGTTATVGYTEDLVQKMISAEVGKIKSEIREEEIKKREQALVSEKREFDRRKSDGIEMFLQNLGTVFPQVKKFMGGGAPAQYAQVAGTTEEQPTVIEVLDNDELSEKINGLLERWNAAEPDWLMIMEKIVKISEDKKGFDLGLMTFDYEKLKGMILNY